MGRRALIRADPTLTVMNLMRTMALLGLAGAFVAAAPAAAAPSVTWTACSDDVLSTDRVPPEDLDRYQALLSALQCGTVRVPLDYRRPRGRWITIGLTRLPAADRAHRQGSLAVNPGGPGGSAYLMPLDLAMTPTSAGLHETYDMIGMDPRGVGYSTRATCEAPEALAGPSDDPTREQALRFYADTVVKNQTCLAAQGDFLRQITTENIARDLDSVRAALGERRLAFLGVSWGTWFGAVYRNLFPEHVSRMWIDSVAPTRFYGDEFLTARSEAQERGADRMTQWIAQHDDVYHFGTTAAAVKAALLDLERSFTEHPRTFTDLPDPIGGAEIALSTAQPSPVWPLAAVILAELRDAQDGTPAPPHVKMVFGGRDSAAVSSFARAALSAEPALPPEDFNEIMNHAAICNEDFGQRDFDTAWSTYQHLRTLPLTGALARFDAQCAGWNPVRPVNLKHSNASLVLSGHRDESVSVYPWTVQMRNAVGGTILTVNDDVHGSALRTDDCGGLIVGYFRTGVLAASQCQGEGENPDPSDV